MAIRYNSEAALELPGVPEGIRVQKLIHCGSIKYNGMMRTITIKLAEMQKIIDAEKSDLFDVLAHVAYALAPLTRAQRAARATGMISAHFNSKQQVFLDFVLSHYISVGVEELDQAKLTPLLRLKYHDSIADAVADIGRPDEICQVFSGFQKYLYQPQSAL